MYIYDLSLYFLLGNSSPAPNSSEGPMWADPTHALEKLRMC